METQSGFWALNRLLAPGVSRAPYVAFYRSSRSLCCCEKLASLPASVSCAVSLGMSVRWSPAEGRGWLPGPPVSRAAVSVHPRSRLCGQEVRLSGKHLEVLSAVGVCFTLQATVSGAGTFVSPPTTATVPSSLSRGLATVGAAQSRHWTNGAPTWL